MRLLVRQLRLLLLRLLLRLASTTSGGDTTDRDTWFALLFAAGSPLLSAIRPDAAQIVGREAHPRLVVEPRELAHNGASVLAALACCTMLCAAAEEARMLALTVCNGAF